MKSVLDEKYPIEFDIFRNVLQRISGLIFCLQNDYLVLSISPGFFVPKAIAAFALTVF